jgi:hypothetical protein
VGRRKIWGLGFNKNTKKREKARCEIRCEEKERGKEKDQSMDRDKRRKRRIVGDKYGREECLGCDGREKKEKGRL